MRSAIPKTTPVVLYHQQGLVLGDPEDQFHRVIRFATIHASTWFIQQNDVCPPCDGDAEFQRPLLGVRQGTGNNVPLFAQADLLNGEVGKFPDILQPVEGARTNTCIPGTRGPHSGCCV